MKTIKIASIGDTKKVCYDAAGTRYFLPERFRATAKVGDYVLLVEKEYNETEKNPDGTTKLDDNQKPIPTGNKFMRTDVTMVGDLKAVTLAKNEDRINDGVAEAIVKQEIATLQKTYQLKDLAAMENETAAA